MHEAFSDILTELAILRKAANLLRDLEQLTDADAFLIAAQVRNVLMTGARHLPLDPEAEADATLTPRDWLPCSNDAAPSWPNFFTVGLRTTQLGYRLPHAQYQAHIPRLEQCVRHEWTLRYHGEPTRHQGHDWYGVEEGAWVDVIIQSYLAAIQGIERTHPVEE